MYKINARHNALFQRQWPRRRNFSHHGYIVLGGIHLIAGNESFINITHLSLVINAICLNNFFALWILVRSAPAETLSCLDKSCWVTPLTKIGSRTPLNATGILDIAERASSTSIFFSRESDESGSVS